MENPKEGSPQPADDSRWRRLPKWLRAPYEWWVYLSSITLFGVGGILLSVVAFVLYFILPKRIGKPFGRRYIMVLFRFFAWYIELWGIATLDLKRVDKLRDQKGIIIAPNHITLWDVVFFISRLPNVVCIAKASVMRNPLFGGYARLARFIPNDSPNAMVKHAAEELADGACLLVFPEGTRTVNPPINSFKGGFALIAKRACAPIQTAFLTTSDPAFTKNCPLFRCPEFPYRYSVRLGERFEIGPDLDTKKFLEDLKSYFHEHLPPDPRRAPAPSPDA